MTKEALKLALEALERGETELRWQAITAIKEALAESEARRKEFSETTKRNMEHVEWYLSTHAPEPVAWLYRDSWGTMKLSQVTPPPVGAFPVYTTLPQRQEPEQEPVVWLITDEKINSLQVDSIQRLIDRARHAHMTDIKLRINGQDEWFEADWLKHLTRTTPPQRKPLTGEQIGDLLLPFPAYESEWDAEDFYRFVKAIEAAHGIKE